MNTSPLSLQFLGAAGTVTGSRHLLCFGGKKILVDCGLFQGIKELRLRNRAGFPVDPSTIDGVILTHAHLDHSGYLPILHREGFQGKIFVTEPTRELARILLADAATIEEEDAAYANEKGYSRHHPAAPLFTGEDARAVLKNFVSLKAGDWTEILPGFRFRFRNAGHIMGSAFAEIDAGGKRLVFSGDLGREHPLLLKPREKLEEADYLVLESTYGDRLHDPESAADALARVVWETEKRGGHLLIPSFAVGRTQDLLLLLSRLRKHSKIPGLPIYLDSPLAEGATEIYLNNPDWLIRHTESAEEIAHVAQVVRSRQQSKDLLQARSSTIVIAGSGMVTGGRILHHLAHRIFDRKNTVLLTGYQAAGTRGRLLRDGAPEIKMHGQWFKVSAHIAELTGLSAHADQSELLSWIGGLRKPPKKIFLVHGEPQAADALRVKIKDQLCWEVEVAAPMETVELG